MPDDKDYSSATHVVMPIKHSDGEIHNVAVPKDTDPGELHSALMDAGYGRAATWAGDAPGLITPGNAHLYNQPSPSTTSFRDDNGRSILVPTTVDGETLSDRSAKIRYYNTGKHLGIFESPEHADAYAKQMKEDYAAGKYNRPTPEGSLEHSKEFKDNVRRLWAMAGGPNSRAEAGNFLDWNEKYSEPVVSKNLESGKGQINFGPRPPGAEDVIHTHPRTGGPSEQDKATAKENHINVYVVDADGLHLVEPDGKVTRVFDSVGQATAETPKKKGR
jgi:hypothetical protein